MLFEVELDGDRGFVTFDYNDYIDVTFDCTDYSTLAGYYLHEIARTWD